MSGYLESGEKKKDSLMISIRGWIRTLIDYFICAYIVVITAVLPFYSENGYSYIATEKSLFFRRVSIQMGKAVLLLLFIYIVFSGAVYLWSRKNRGREEIPKELWAAVRRKFSAADIFAGLYGLALVISYLCSEYKERAKWGAEGWFMGLYIQLILLAAYFLVSKFWKPRKFYFYLMFGASAVVFLLGYLNRFGVYPIEMELRNSSFISTIGNMNWYCGYVVTVLFVGVAFFWQKGSKGRGQKSGRILLALYSGLGFGTLVTQGSTSGIVTLGAVMLALFILSVGAGERMQRFWGIALLLSGVCLATSVVRAVFPERLDFTDEFVDLLTTGAMPIVMTILSGIFLLWTNLAKRRGTYREKSVKTVARVIMIIVSISLVAFIAMIVLNTVRPGSLGSLSENKAFIFSSGWGSNRGETWNAGIQCFLAQDPLHKLVGVGPDAMVAYLYNSADQGLLDSLKAAFGPLYLTNVHNEWLTLLVDVGILGLVSFVGMIACAAVKFLRQIGKNPMAAACGFALFAYTVNNIFSFQQIMNVTSLYVIMGMGAAFLSADAADI